MDIVSRIVDYIVNPLIYLLVGLAVIYFLFGVFKFVKNADNPEERLTGARHIIWGAVGIVVIFGAFTLVHIVMNTLGGASSHPASLSL